MKIYQHQPGQSYAPQIERLEVEEMIEATKTTIKSFGAVASQLTKDKRRKKKFEQMTIPRIDGSKLYYLKRIR